MQLVPVEEKAEKCAPYLQRAGLVPTPLPEETRVQVAAVVRAAGDRIKVAGDILDYADFFTPDDRLSYNEAAVDKRLRRPAEAGRLLAGFRDRLAGATAFDAASLERLLNDFIAAEGVPIVQIIHAVRVAVTGKGVGFGLFETLAILGKQRCLARIDRALALIPAR